MNDMIPCRRGGNRQVADSSVCLDARATRFITIRASTSLISRRSSCRLLRAVNGVLRRLPSQPFEQALDRGADFSAGGFFFLPGGGAKKTFSLRPPPEVGKGLPPRFSSGTASPSP